MYRNCLLPPYPYLYLPVVVVKLLATWQSPFFFYSDSNCNDDDDLIVVVAVVVSVCVFVCERNSFHTWRLREEDRATSGRRGAVGRLVVPR